MFISFECKKCENNFESNVGGVSFDLTNGGTPKFKKNPYCDNCGELDVKDVWLSEEGQGQLTEIYMNSQD